MIKLSIVILLLIEVEPFVCSRELNLNEIFLALIAPYFDLYLSVMFEFCTISTYLKIRKEQKKHLSRPSPKDADGTFQFKGARSITRKRWSL